MGNMGSSFLGSFVFGGKLLNRGQNKVGPQVILPKKFGEGPQNVMTKGPKWPLQMLAYFST